MERKEMKDFKWFIFLCVMQDSVLPSLMQFITLLHPNALSFPNKTKQANWLAQGYTSHVISFIIGVSVDATGSEESIDAHWCVYRAIFRSRFVCPLSTAFQRRHFVAFHDTAYTFSEVNTRDKREWITRTRMLNCRKFSANFTDDAHELPSVQLEQLCMHPEVRL